MTTIQNIIEVLEDVAPPRFQESYDNAGLIVGDHSAAVSGVLVALDSTEEVVEEAVRRGCNLIVAHHPIVFKGLKQITGEHYVQRVVIKAIQNDIAIYAIHTNLDNVYFHGVNQMIAQKLGLVDVRILAPKKGLEHQSAAVGSGMIGSLPEPAEEMTFLQSLKDKMQAGCIKHTRLLGKKIKTVALCGGAGSFLLGAAIRNEADIFVSADFKYHEFFDANGEIIIADIGHFESEQYTIELLINLLSDKFSTFAVHSTKVHTNPVLYL